MTRLLAVSGSLQARSSNGALVRAMAASFEAAAGGDATTTFTRALHELPPFNTDTDVDPAPPAVSAWRAELAAPDAVIIATPEYAFGIAGALKNALDWVVGSGELVDKPVLLAGASTLETGAGFAIEALERTIRVMSANVVGTLSVPFSRAKIAEGEIIDETLRTSIGALAVKLVDAIRTKGAP